MRIPWGFRINTAKGNSFSEILGQNSMGLAEDFSFQEIFLFLLSNMGVFGETPKAGNTAPAPQSDGWTVKGSPGDIEEQINHLSVASYKRGVSFYVKDNTTPEFATKGPILRREKAIDEENFHAVREIALAFLQFLQDTLGLREAKVSDFKNTLLATTNNSFQYENFEKFLKTMREEILERIRGGLEKIIPNQVEKMNPEDLSLREQFKQTPFVEDERGKFQEVPKNTIIKSLMTLKQTNENSPVSDFEVVNIKHKTYSMEELSALEDLLRRVEEEFKKLIPGFSGRELNDAKDLKRRGFNLGDVIRDNEIMENTERLSLREEFENLPLRLQEEVKRHLGKLISEINEKSLGLTKGDQFTNDQTYDQGILTYTKSMELRVKEVVQLTPELQANHKVPLRELPHFIRDFSTELLPSGERRAQLRLEPPELGKMELEVRVHEGEVEVRARVEKQEVYAQLQQDLALLKAQLEEIGLKLRDFQLALGFSEEGKGFAEERRSKEEKGKLRPQEASAFEDVNTQIHHTGRLYKIV